MTEGLEAEYDFSPMNAMREGEVAVGLMDAMHDIQLQLDPLSLSIQQRWLNEGWTDEEAQRAFDKEIVPIIQSMRGHHSGLWAKDSMTGEPGPNEGMIHEMLQSYWEQIERNMGR